MAGCSEAALADPAEVSEDIDPAAAACIAAAEAGGGEGEWLWPRSRWGGTTLDGGMVSRCRRAAS